MTQKHTQVSLIGCFAFALPTVLKSFELVIIGRALMGFTDGVAPVAAAVYISEISESHNRGQFGACSLLGVASGVVTAQVSQNLLSIARGRLLAFLVHPGRCSSYYLLPFSDFDFT